MDGAHDAMDEWAVGEGVGWGGGTNFGKFPLSLLHLPLILK